MKSHSATLQAFKSYDEAGERRRIQTLKYLVLANMLMESQVDPFDAQEAKPYKTDSEVQAMTNLVDAYQRNNIKDFEKILRTNKYALCPCMQMKQITQDFLCHDAQGMT